MYVYLVYIRGRRLVSRRRASFRVSSERQKSMSEGCDVGESSPSAAASASPGSAGICAGTETAALVRFCCAKRTASVTVSVANGSASAPAPGAPPPGLATLEGDAALAAEGDAGDVPGFGSPPGVDPRGSPPGPGSVFS